MGGDVKRLRKLSAGRLRDNGSGLEVSGRRVGSVVSASALCKRGIKRTPKVWHLKPEPRTLNREL